MFDHISIDPALLESVLQYGLPAALGFFMLALTAFGAYKTVENIIAIKRLFWPMVDESTDVAIVALAKALSMTPEQVVAIFKTIGDQVDPATQIVREVNIGGVTK